MDRIARRADWSSHRMRQDLRSTIRLGQALPSNEGLRQGTAQDLRRAMGLVTMALDLQMYRGRVGDPIRILAKDDVGLISVEVRIDKQDGTDVERGVAVESGVRLDFFSSITILKV